MIKLTEKVLKTKMQLVLYIIIYIGTQLAINKSVYPYKFSFQRGCRIRKCNGRTQSQKLYTQRGK